MRVIWLAPLAFVLGCAHQSSNGAVAENSPPPVAAAKPAAPPAPAKRPSAPQASARPPRLACAPVKVHFALDSDQLYDSEKPLLDTTARCLRDNDQQRVSIVGNADERGSAEYNQDLGQRRAQAVATYLEEKGAAPTQVEAVIS
ncbi:MAG: OmpA family protein, partial [Myxococcales bacterium]|nr:OmpA family protein [Myxococcales bacterium]